MDALINQRKKKKFRRYIYPGNVLRASHILTFSRYGIDYKISKNEAEVCKNPFKGRESGYGYSILLSDESTAEKAAAEKAAEKAAAEKAAEKTAAQVLELTEEAKQIIERLNKNQ